MTTARDLVTLALKECGVLGVGQDPLAQDINDSFTLLTRMMAQWQRRRWLVPGLTKVSMPGNGLISNLIGPGQYYNAIRPDKVQAAYFIQNNVGGGSPVSYPLRPIFSYEDYARIVLKELNTWPVAYFYDGAFPYGNVYIWPIPSSSYTIHLILKMPIGFNTSISEGEITDAGALYTDGVYPVIDLTGGKEGASGATANITVAGGVVTVCEIQGGGNGYALNDVLSAAAADIGGTGSGFEFKVTGVTSSLDSEFDMPPEYEEAIHYNLAIRLCSMYQRPVKPSTGALAKVSLQTIRTANIQIPTMVMPPALNRGPAFSIYNPDGWGGMY